jgi:hypothetical protein
MQGDEPHSQSMIGPASLVAGIDSITARLQAISTQRIS